MAVVRTHVVQKVQGRPEQGPLAMIQRALDNTRALLANQMNQNFELRVRLAVAIANDSDGWQSD